MDKYLSNCLLTEFMFLQKELNIYIRLHSSFNINMLIQLFPGINRGIKCCETFESSHYFCCGQQSSFSEKTGSTRILLEAPTTTTQLTLTTISYNLSPKSAVMVYCITDHIIYYEFFLQSQWLQGIQEKKITLMMLPQYWGLGYIVWYEMKSTWVKGIVMGGEQKHTHTHSHSPNTDSNPETPA